VPTQWMSSGVSRHRGERRSWPAVHGWFSGRWHGWHAGDANLALQSHDRGWAEVAVLRGTDPALNRAGRPRAHRAVDRELAASGDARGRGRADRRTDLRARHGPGGTTDGAGQASALATGRPGAGSLRRQDALGGRDLGRFAGKVGARCVAETAVSLPGRAGELQSAVVAVAGLAGPCRRSRRRPRSPRRSAPGRGR
jgi:hypothetical protein